MKDGIKEILESRQCPGIIGTRDTFGIGKEFRDEATGKIVDNHRTWEKLGYCQAKDTFNFKDKRGDIKGLVKEKLEKKKWRLKNES